MAKQNYQNHVRYYPAHHFVFYPVLMILTGASIYYAVKSDEYTLIWTFIAIGLFMTGWLSFMLRQHYALNNQNRIVRLEMRFRYYLLTNQRLDLLENQLSFGQLSALRFASDEELVALTERTLKENLAPNEIKRSIKNWQPDHMRV
ncbi:DUF6526 family protein [Dyadobacter sediminis]|uniref:Uncharacterized protein n=1 Tax=Dyadobacter sediminis TaxID=1493691 RepID=A0A5R9KI91_9BACT|nr:DUF6526 family protein [Dyadobacter sediminis]TLU95943.1 hypothetical protein FEM55_01980 [Dyadobacter sediminis]GGB77933.1 hypothetical protein GCM10011325_01780 [Dyadobacter sediminis]